MKQFIRYQRTIMYVVIALAAIGTAGLYLGVPDDSSIALGWALGSAVSVVVYRARVLRVVRLADIPPEQWKSHSIRSGLFTYVFTAGAVIAAGLLAQFNIVATFAGVLLERVVLIGDGFIRPAALAETDLPAETDEETA